MHSIRSIENQPGNPWRKWVTYFAVTIRRYLTERKLWYETDEGLKEYVVLTGPTVVKHHIALTAKYLEDVEL